MPNGALLFFDVSVFMGFGLTSVLETSKENEACFFINSKGGIMLKRVLSVIGIFATMAAAETSAIWNGTANTSWYNAEQTTFIIETAEELAGLAKLVNGGNDFRNKTINLGANIMLNNTTNWQNWETNPPVSLNSWEAIGIVGINGFNGTFDGYGFAVSGVYINISNSNQGLFGFVGSRGTIKNLGVVASFVKGGERHIGILVGANNGTITNCWATGSVRGNVSAVGGLVGYNHNGTIINSYSFGDVQGGNDVGGLVGANDGLNGTITNSYSVGNVRGDSYVGGLVGRNLGSSISITNSYHLTTPAAQSTFIGWNFNNIWGINPNINNGYPYLRYFVDVRVDWDKQTTFIFNGEEQAPTATANFVSNGRDVPIIISGARRNVSDNYTAIARLTTPNPNIVLLDTTRTFAIDVRKIDVEWENTGPFVFNWTSQRPIAKPEIIRRNDGSVIMEIPFNVVVQQDVFAGSHTAEAVARIDEWDKPNISLSATRFQDFVIQPRPLTPRLRNTPGDTIRTPIGLTEEQLYSILAIEIDFNGFLMNPRTQELDGKSTLDSVRFRIQNDDSQHSLRSQGALTLGEHIVTVSGGSQNYTILPERKIVVIIGERFLILENYPRDNPTAICDVKKSDNRHGIRFAVNPVSEKAEISVILPNNEHIANANVVIYDMTGNVIFSTTAHDNVLWDLRNGAGRIVANGTYLVVVEAKCRSGKVYRYSARLGVKR